MDAQGEFINVGALAAKVEDADLGIGNTTIEAGFGVWLKKTECQLSGGLQC